MVERSRRSVGATLAAARERGPTAIGSTVAQPTSPAARITPSAIAAKAIASSTTSRSRPACCSATARIARIAVVDCDVHQGNGTAAIFSDDPTVFTFSMHGAHNFPFRKEVSDLDVTFEDGAGDDEYLAALTTHLPRVLDGQRPDLVFYLAGADPYEGDRLGRLKLTIAGLRAARPLGASTPAAPASSRSPSR